jgi:hypothetical protein
MGPNTNGARSAARMMMGGFCLGLVACPPTQPPEDPRLVSEICVPSLELTGPDCEELCPRTRRMAPCGHATRGWAQVSPDDKTGDCVYAWQGDQDPDNAPADAIADCKVVPQAPTPSIDPLIDALATDFFRDALGFERGGVPPEVFSDVDLHDGKRVMIAIVDTAPPGGGKDAVDGRGRHGRAMAEIARMVACGPLSPEDCAVDVVTFLGLPRPSEGEWIDEELCEGMKDDGEANDLVFCDGEWNAGAFVSFSAPDRPLATPEAARNLPSHRGGFFGYQSDLDHGIRTALRAYEARKQDEPELKLIINLSVGWEPACSLDLEIGERFNKKKSPLAKKIVGQQLQHAHDTYGNDLLVFAASGNRIIGSCEDGPTAPATWEIGNFVHGVTPLDDQLRSLATFRPGSNAKLATRGFMAVVGGYGPLSGSSVSAAVASGIAARVWVERLRDSKHPHPAHDVIQQLSSYGHTRPSGDPTRPWVRADYPSGTSDDQRVISLCHALGRSDCRTSRDLVAGERVGPTWSRLSPGTDDAVPDAPSPFVSCDDCSGAHQPTRISRSSSSPALVHSHRRFMWVVPQPNIPPCPSCGIKVSSSEVKLKLDDAFAPYDLTSTTITLWNSQDASEAHVYQALTLDTTTWKRVSDVEFGMVGPAGREAPTTRGYVTMAFTDNRTNPPTTFTVGNELIIDDTAP